ncbi:alpha/beta fold hydrolase [Streptomyces sp. NPDC048297]|uniref:alpha/beta fold hydrolase n=1 Tax=Streptomyces sp. NPDC048297 TaxID=3365531 RepID=UPI00371B4ED2
MTTSGILKSGKGRPALGVAVLSALTVVPAHAAGDLGRATAAGDLGRATGGQKPTVVLVHGAFADGSSWNGVVQRLQHDGYRVIAPPNSFAGLSGKFPPAPLTTALKQVPFRNGDGTTGTDVHIQADKLHATFAQDLPQQQASVMASTQRPIAQSGFTDKLTAAAWRDKPVCVLVGRQDRAINPSLERYEAKRAHARKTVEINSSHVSLVSHPRRSRTSS